MGWANWLTLLQSLSSAFTNSKTSPQPARRKQRWVNRPQSHNRWARQLSLTKLVFLLPGIVAAKGQAGQIVALDRQVQAQFRRLPGCGLYHRRQHRQRNAGVIGQAAKITVIILI